VVERSDSSSDVTFRHRCFSSGMNVRLGAAIRQPEGESRIDR
jgi:hypothetical protein